MGEVNVTFKKPVHKIVDRIKSEPYFQWPNKMGGGTYRGEIRTCIAFTIETKGILSNNARC